MPEGIELPEAHHEHKDHPLVLPVSITMSILAVLIASAAYVVPHEGFANWQSLWVAAVVVALGVILIARRDART